MSNKLQSTQPLKCCFNWTLPKELLFSFTSKPGVHLQFYDLQDGRDSFLNWPQTGGIKRKSSTEKREQKMAQRFFLLFKGFFWALILPKSCLRIQYRSFCSLHTSQFVVRSHSRAPISQR